LKPQPNVFIGSEAYILFEGFFEKGHLTWRCVYVYESSFFFAPWKKNNVFQTFITFLYNAEKCCNNRRSKQEKKNEQMLLFDSFDIRSVNGGNGTSVIVGARRLE
jgi:hypothetical protein